jgi:hypothetical protein
MKNYLECKTSSQMATEEQVASAAPGMVAFLAPLLTGPDRSCRALGRWRARIEGKNSSKAAQYGELFARLIRIRENTGMPTTYPRPALAWHYAEIFRAAGDSWVAGPLMLYAIGHLEEFVSVIYRADRELTPAEQLLRLMEALPGALAGSERLREIWAAVDGTAFPAPATIPKDLQLTIPDPILLAASVARDFSLPYPLQRKQVLVHLRDWLSFVVDQPPEQRREA